MISFASYSPEGKSLPFKENIGLISPSGEEKQKDILDSIRYASRIQRALITSEKYIARQLAKRQASTD